MKVKRRKRKAGFFIGFRLENRYRINTVERSHFGGKEKSIIQENQNEWKFRKKKWEMSIEQYFDTF